MLKRSGLPIVLDSEYIPSEHIEGYHVTMNLPPQYQRAVIAHNRKFPQIEQSTSHHLPYNAPAPFTSSQYHLTSKIRPLLPHPARNIQRGTQLRPTLPTPVLVAGVDHRLHHVRDDLALVVELEVEEGVVQAGHLRPGVAL